ncbi:hypothetical protein [Streptomyces sp. NPDC058542]
MLVGDRSGDRHVMEPHCAMLEALNSLRLHLDQRQFAQRLS